MSVSWMEARQYTYTQYNANPIVRNLIRQMMLEPEDTDIFAIFTKVLPPEPEREWWVGFKHQFWIFFSSEYRKKYVTSIKKINNTALRIIGDLDRASFQQQSLERFQHIYTRLKAGSTNEDIFLNQLMSYIITPEKSKEEIEIEKLQQQVDKFLGKHIELANLHDDIEEKKLAVKNCCERIQKFKTYFPDTKLSEAANLINTKELPGSLTPKEQILKDIAERIHPDMQKVWQQLFEKYPEGTIKAWSCHPETGDFILTLNQTLKMWVPSTDMTTGKEHPKGGVVLMLGPVERNNQVTGKLDKDKKEMQFKDGFWVRCKHTVPKFNVYIKMTPYVEKLTYKSHEEVIFSAGLRFKFKNFTEHHPKSIDYLIKNWAENGLVVENPDAIIDEKLGEKH